MLPRNSCTRRTPMRSLLGLLLLSLTLTPLQAGEPVVKPPRADQLGDALPAHAAARLGTPRWGKTGWHATLVHNADGEVLAAGQSEEGIGLWDVGNAKRLHFWKGIKHYSLPHPC